MRLSALRGLALPDVQSLHKLTAGDGYLYLIRQVAVLDGTDRGAATLGAYYSEKGETPGRWWGSGLKGVDIEAGAEVTEQQMKNLFGDGRHPNAQALEDAASHPAEPVAAGLKRSEIGMPFRIHTGTPEYRRLVTKRLAEHNMAHGVHWRTPIPEEIRARLRTEVGREYFERKHGRAPLDARELSGFIAQESRQFTTAVAGFDLTFTPVKSVSALWAVADPDVAEQIAEAHDTAVNQTLEWLERNVAYTRRGRRGEQQIDTRGLMATVFTHRDARSGDPNLHTHVAVSSKVQDLDGQWRALDARVLYKANVTSSEMYNTLLECQLTGRLGVQFAERGDAEPGKREVREIVGLDQRLLKAWAKRRGVIDQRRRELAVQFQRTHGRPPTATEQISLAQQANLETRQAKHEPRSEADQRATWFREAAAVLGSGAAVRAMITDVLSGSADTQKLTQKWIRQTAEQVIDRVQNDRATWQAWHVHAEAERAVRAGGIRARDHDRAVEALLARVLDDLSIPFSDSDPIVDPAPLTRRDGVSVYRIARSKLHTSKAILAAEQRILAVAQQHGGPRISEVRVGIAVAETAANGITLNAAQAAMVREFATSGARLQLGLAPAGTGKTTAMEVLARAWTSQRGHSVVGLAPSAAAAKELGESIGGRTDTLSKLTWTLDNRSEHRWPAWIKNIDRKTLVIIDEAGMAATTELAAAVDFIIGRGGAVRLIGDDRQLAAVNAGGVLRDISTTVGAVTLSEVRRFVHPDGSLNNAEAAASLALRDGDPAALAYYADRGRIHVGDLGAVADQAYQAWAADRRTGKQSILLAPTRELVAELNTRARNDRLAATTASSSDLSSEDGTSDSRPVGRQVILVDGTVASAGDTIVTRRNARRLKLTRTDWVKNGDRWTVTDVHHDGSLTVTHIGLGRAVRLPARYVAEHVQLGYASTIHGAQGITVDRTHTVLAGTEDRSLLYVGVTRGRDANHIYLSVGTDGDPHDVIKPDTLLPPTAIDVLTSILARDDSAVSATTEQRRLDDPFTQLREATERYHDAVTFAAEHTIGAAAAEAIERRADQLVLGLTDQAAWPTLRTHLILRAANGDDPARILREAVAQAPLGDADDVAAVLDYRIGGNPGVGPMPWLPGIPRLLTGHKMWGGYLADRRQRTADLLEEVGREVARWTPGSAPAWALPLLHPADAPLLRSIAVWRAVFDVDPADHRPTGPRQVGAEVGSYQRGLDKAYKAITHAGSLQREPWYETLPDAVREDPWMLQLGHRLRRLARAGLEVNAHLADALDDERPLPDEMPAAALWWRLAHHLGPAATVGDTLTADYLQPAWLPELRSIAGDHLADQLQHAPAWPALVAAVDGARAHDWDPRHLLKTAIGVLDPRLRGDEVCDALVLRIAVLTDPPPDHETLPVDPEAAEHQPPADSHLVHRATDELLPVFDGVADLPLGGEEPPPHPDDLPPEDLHLAAPSSGSAGPPAPATRAAASVPEMAPARIVDLHAAAVEFYQNHYPTSWAPSEIAKRLGVDPANTGFVVGYAPPGPTSLIRHLTARGATEAELEAAGLARRRNGDLVDVFRDRIVFAIHDADGQPIGFTARRNPTRTDDPYAGPKYLNTKTTPVFQKSEILYGLNEHADLLRAGAIPVIGEGAFDAEATTIAGAGEVVGLATCGTAL